MTAYYNEIDPQAAQWLRNLIAAGHIAAGEVDCRSILEVRPDELAGFTQCHFFAGIGVWSHALRSAGWPDDRPVWTGSCPCQPFSAAGKGDEFADERHLWPTWFRLIRECRPRVVFGEQVASKDALTWLDHVSADLEGEGYAIGAVDTCAAGVGAPHVRQRLFFVGHAIGAGLQARGGFAFGDEARPAEPTDSGASGQLADTQSRDRGRELKAEGARSGRPGSAGGCRMDDADGARGAIGLPESTQRKARDAGVANDSGGEPPRACERSAAGWLGDTDELVASDGSLQRGGELRRAEEDVGAGATAGFWGDAEWLPCRDGKWRPVEPGSFPLAHGAPARLVRLRAYGNAIVAPVAAEFIRAYLDVAA